MPPRAYNNETRLQQQAELKARIAAAAAQLHAEKGALRTSWAEIAEAAGVSLPTVYKHFPDFDALIPACTGHAAQFAPPLPVERILACEDLPAASQALAQACDQRNAFFEPWMAWGEARQIESLSRILAQQRVEFTGFCRQVLQRHLPGAAGLDEMAAQWQALLDFEIWHALVRQHGLPRAAARRHITHLLLAVTGPQPAAPAPRPNRK
ncbi:TetR/AcrR family transcriptional regulator [Ramlibacter henchirensis]|uniref:TetR/AcrR family transcriptional regulator n=1 Tax=Ramlibacter henchirensis TaxID=204072 RepID=A0A4Z0C728_9BURK|nr:TetR/AcrR family transcriptional regulator [Ramlibacter henchirensis]TFZ06784.1 TetR/AcrR family transcriptional regulator [Ramlibacter henchirensis]